MVNLHHPVPGGDFDRWGNHLNDNDANLSEAIDDVVAKADQALAAATSAITTASSVAATASAAQATATAASNAASGAGSAATAVSTALNAHKTDGDPHPQYLNPTRGDARYVRNAGVAGSTAEPVLAGAASSQGVSFALSFSPFGLRNDGTSYYDAAGVPAADRAYPVVQADGSVRLVRIGAIGGGSDLVPPTLSGIASSNLSAVAATVTVTSNETATAVLEYGTTTAYGQSVSALGVGTSFTVQITGLTASTLYHYRWRVTDLAGNLTVSSDGTFTTSAAGAAPASLANFTPAGVGSEVVSMFAADLSSANHWVQATVSGNTDGDKSAAIILRGNSSGTQGVRLAVGGNDWTILNGPSTILTAGTWTRPAGSGTLRGEIIGTTVAFYWNGGLIASRDLGAAISAIATNKRPGVGVLQDVASAVSMTSITAGASTTSTPPPDNGGGTPPPGSPGAKAQAMFGPTLSGLPWHSGAWVTGDMSASNGAGFSTWRGSQLDFYTVYPGYNTWDEMNSSEWVQQLLSGFPGRLNYGLPMLPRDRVGQWADVTGGSHDYVFTKIANDLKNAGRTSSVIRVGLECNGSWFPWGVTWSTYTQFVAAFRRIVGLFRAVSTSFKFAFCWNVYTLPSGMPSGTAPTAQLDKFYPGDDVVDLIELDFYNFDNVVAANDSQWAYTVNPLPGVGLNTIATYARSHNKGVWFGEWGLHSVTGPGDSPFFIQKVWEWCVANSDVLVGECYFNEPASYIANGIGWPSNQNPNSATAYKKKWGYPLLYPTGQP